jgi:alanine racemase
MTLTKTGTDAQGPWLDVDLSAVERNARRYAELVGAPLLPMIKANGYGIGAVAVARTLERLAPWGFGVATLGEAAELRDAGVTRPIVAFIPCQPEWIDEYERLEVRPMIGDLAALEAWTARGSRPFHIVVDTGMSRTGFRWSDRVLIDTLGRRLENASGWEGIATHFHSSDDNPDSTRLQWDRFRAVVDSLPRRPALIHASNSAGAQYGRDYAGTLARPGIFLYGGAAGRLQGEAVAAFRAVVVAVRSIAPGETVSYQGTFTAREPITIATLGAGYADGVPRALGGGVGQVEWNGALYPIAGRVTMDMTMVAVPDTVRPGQVMTLFGGAWSIEECARAAGTISYQILACLGRRVVRRYRPT